MKSSYLLYVCIPLIPYLICVIWYEIKTNLILDKVTIPAAIVFTTFPFFFKGSHWLSPVAGMIALLIFFLIAAMIYEKATWKICIGGGAIKLMASVGAAVGIEYSIPIALIFTFLTIISIIISNYKYDIDALPSSPFALIAVVSTVIIYQFTDFNIFVG